MSEEQQPTVEQLQAENAELRRQRDRALARVAELTEDIETHRGAWRRSAEEVEEAKTVASRAESRAKRLESKERRDRMRAPRRRRDAENEALREVVERRHGALVASLPRSPLSTERREILLGEYNVLIGALRQFEQAPEGD